MKNIDNSSIEKQDNSEKKECNDIELPMSLGPKGNTQKDIIEWYRKNISSLIGKIGDSRPIGIVAVKADGGIALDVYKEKQYLYSKDYTELLGWNDIVSIACGDDFVVGLRKNGTVVCGGPHRCLLEHIEHWTEIVSIVVFSKQVVGLRKDGTVTISISINKFRAEDLEEKVEEFFDDDDDDFVENFFHRISAWTNIVSIGVTADGSCIWGVRKDGTVAIETDKSYDLHEIETWTDITSVFGRDGYVAGLRKDGTVVWLNDRYGYQQKGRIIEWEWTDIVSICYSAGYSSFVVGLRKDGTVKACEESGCFDLDSVGNWTDIISIVYFKSIDVLAGLKKNGHVVAARVTGSRYAAIINRFIECMGTWENIIAINIDSYSKMIGLTSDGRVICTEYTKRRAGLLGLREEIDKVFTRDTGLKLF